mgnify:CR=1 FL=1
MFLENTLNFNKQTGWIEVVCGSMFSGKTEELIRRMRRAQYANLDIIIFKPKILSLGCNKKFITYTSYNYK